MKRDDEPEIPYRVEPRAVSSGSMQLGAGSYVRSQKIKEGAEGIPFAPRVRAPKPQNPICSSRLPPRRK